MSATKNHDYHLVAPDPWPLIGAISGGLFFGGFVMWLHENPYGKFVMALGLVGVLTTMFNWWSNTIKEAHAEGDRVVLPGEAVVEVGRRAVAVVLVGVGEKVLHRGEQERPKTTPIRGHAAKIPTLEQRDEEGLHQVPGIISRSSATETSPRAEGRRT